MRADVTQAARVLAFELENVRYQVIKNYIILFKYIYQYNLVRSISYKKKANKTNNTKIVICKASRTWKVALNDIFLLYFPRQENKLGQELKELKAREEYLREQFAGHDSFLQKELLKIGIKQNEKTEKLG